MNEKVLTMALMLVFVMIGINAFLLMASTNLYDEQGNQLNIYYGMDTGGFGQTIQDDASAISISSGVSISSTAPGDQQGLTVVSRNNNPIGLDTATDLTKLGIGSQLVLLKLSEMFPIISPITNGIAFFVFAIQSFALAYLGSILIRGILGRIR